MSLPSRKSIQFPTADYWPVLHDHSGANKRLLKLRVQKKYRNRWPREVRSFWSNFLGLHTRWTNWKSYMKQKG